MKDELALARQRFQQVDSAGADSGTRCSFPAFMRSAGIVHTAPLRSISDQRAPITSPVRAAVRIANSSARALTPSLAQLGHEGRELAHTAGPDGCWTPAHLAAVRQELVEMPAPARRVLAFPISPRLRPIEHGLDAAPHPASRLRLRRPDRLQRLQHQPGIDGSNRQGRRTWDRQ